MKKICFFTGSRAEYWLLRSLIRETERSERFDLQLIVSGMHLSPEFGHSYRDIERDGFHIDEKVEILLSSDSAVGTCKSVGLAVAGIGEALARLRPDILVLLGDRFETFAAASAATLLSLPIAHLHGGEITQGAYDDALRHSITKMSHMHFTSTAEYRRRVIQMGEHPDTVFNVGSLGVENMRKMPLLSRENLEREIGFSLGKRSALVTFHPVTREKDTAVKQFEDLLQALDVINPLQIIFTKANSDAGGREINRLIDDYVDHHPLRAISFTSMGQKRYFSAMQYVDAVIGNSSSGIIEAPSFNLATVNIGDRQKGRVKAATVIDCSPRKRDIVQACERIFDPQFILEIKKSPNPYEQQDTTKRVMQILENTDTIHIAKKFRDLNKETGEFLK